MPLGKQFRIKKVKALPTQIKVMGKLHELVGVNELQYTLKDMGRYHKMGWGTKILMDKSKRFGLYIRRPDGK
jgi:hypothetical protein